MDKISQKAIRDAVRLNVTNCKHLTEIKDLLHKYSHETKDEYVEEKFIKYCLINLCDDIRLLLYGDSILLDNLKDFIADLDNPAKLFENPHEIFSSSQYANLLLTAAPLLSVDKQQYICFTLKTKILTELVETGNALQQASKLLSSSKLFDIFSEFLMDIKTQFLVPDPKFLENLKCGKVLGNVDQDWFDFQNWYSRDAERLSRQHKNIVAKLIDEFTKFGAITAEQERTLLSTLDKVRTSPKLNVKVKNDRRIISVQQPVLVLSKCLPLVEEKLKTCKDIEKIEFQAEYIFYINTSLEHNFWHGVNIEIVADQINYVSNNLHWIVSGLNERVTAQSKANSATMAGQNGCDGEDGVPGESGGNIVMIAKTYLDINKLLIHTNGADGSHGQHGGDGGNGENGKNGNSISFEEFKQHFESPLNIAGNHQDKILKAVNYLRSNSKHFVVSKQNMNDEVSKVGNEALPNRYIYYCGTLENNIEYEYCFSQWKLGRSMYVLFKGESGTAGKPGGSGGSGGKGGQGGYPGTVQLLRENKPVEIENYPKIKACSGKSGSGGKQGLGGKTGLTGVPGQDVGMVCYYLWKKPLYYTGKKFQIREPEKPTKDSFWCKMYNKYREISPTLTKQASAVVTHDEADTTKVNINQVVAVKKSAINISKAINNLGNFESIHTSTANDVASNGQVWNELTTRSRQKLEQFRSLNANETKLIDIHIRSPIAAKLSISQIQSKGNFISILEEFIASKFPDLPFKEILESYKINVPDEFTWKSSLIKMPTEPGPNSLFHALYGANFFGILTLDSQQATKRRLQVVDDLLAIISESCPDDWITDLINVFDNLTNSSRHPFLDEDLLNRFEALKNKLSVQVSAEGIDFIGHLDKRQLAKHPEAQEILKEVLTNDSVHINTYEAQILVRSTINDLQIFENNQKSPCYLHINLQDKVFKNTATVLALDSNLNFSRVLPAACRSWTHLENWLDNLELEDTFPSIETSSDKETRESLSNIDKIVDIWPRKYSHIFLQVILHNKPKTLQEIHASQLMLQELSTAIYTNSDFLPLFHILLTYPCLQWPAEICLFLLENQMTETFSDYDSVSKTYKEYRAILAEFPAIILCHLVDLIKQSSSKYSNEFVKPVLKTELVELKKYQPFDSASPYDELEGMATISQWHQQLSKIYCMNRLQRAIPNFMTTDQPKQTSELFYYYYNLVDKFTKLDEFLAICNNKLLQASSQSWTADEISSILGKFHSGRWSLDDAALNLLIVSDSCTAFARAMDNHVVSNMPRTFLDLSNIINSDTQTDASKLQINQLIEIAKEYTETRNIELLEFCESDLTTWATDFKQKLKSKLHKSKSRENAILVCQILQKIEHAIYDSFQHKLYDTQKLSILSAASYTLSLFHGSSESENHTSEEHLKNILLQVSTGEGKSYIVLALAIIRALFGLRSDIITSSSVLAERDCRKFQKIFSLFGISAGTITTDDSQQRAIQYQKTVVYGEVSQFQRDYLIDHFYNQNTRGDRQFEGLIIDEVDSMFLDKGNNVLYLSHHPATLDALERIFLCIWQATLQMINKNDYQPLKIFDTILSTIKPILKTEHLEKFKDPEKIWEILLKSGVISSNGDVLDANPAKLVQAPLELDTSAILGLLTILKETLHSTENFIPNHLCGFIELHLLDWIKSAYQATIMEDGVQYVLHPNRFSLDGDKHEKILIIDLDTGTDLQDSHWGDGLHQFLQLKHGCKLAPLSLKSVFVSNITYFNLYKNMVGLTGTLGSNYERHFLKQTYNVNFLVIPTAFPSSFIEEEPIVCENQNKWHEIIYKDIIEKLEQTRSVLIICESIKKVNQIHAFVRQQNTKHQVVLYRRDSENCEVATSKEALNSGIILISTNLAGRGTDIKLSKALLKAGGLHVILSYLPNNSRIRWQGMGRAGRTGNPGSGRLIFCVHSEHDQQTLSSPIDYITQKEAEEQSRISEILRYYNNVVRCEEEKFNEFKQKFNLTRRKLEEMYTKYCQTNTAEEDALLRGNSQDVKQIELQNMLLEWTFWLDKYSTHLRVTQPRKHLSRLEHQFCKQEHANLISEFVDKFQTFEQIESYSRKSKVSQITELILGGRYISNNKPLISDVSLAVKAALPYLKSKHLTLASTILEGILEKHEDATMPTAVAKYYLILAKLMQGHSVNQKQLTQEIFKLIKLLQQHYEFQNSISKAVSGNTLANQQNVQMQKGLMSQKTARSGLLAMYINSLSKVIGKMDVQPEDFLDLVGNDSVEATILHRTLLHANVLQYPEYKELDNEESVEALQNLANKAYTKLDPSNRHMDSLARQKDLVNENYRNLTKNRRKLKHRFYGISSKGFLAEIKNAIQISAKFLVISKSNDGNSTNHLQDWLKNQYNQGQTICLTTSNTDLANFEGEVVLLASLNKDDLHQLVCRDKQIATKEMVVAVNVQKLRDLKLEKYSRLVPKDFEEFCSIDKRTSTALYEELKTAEVIDDNGYLQTNDILEAIQNQQDYGQGSLFQLLPENLQSQIFEMIVSKCAYQYEKLRILSKIDSEIPCISINLPKSCVEQGSTQNPTQSLLLRSLLLNVCYPRTLLPTKFATREVYYPRCLLLTKFPIYEVY